VDFDLSDDQQALQAAAGSLLDDRATMTRVRAAADTDAHLDRDLWADMAEQGWLAIERNIDDGGLGLGLVEVAVLCEQLGRHLAPVPYLGTLMALGALGAGVSSGDVPSDAAVGGTELGSWAERLQSGDAIGAVAWSRRPDAVRAQVGADGSWTLTGRADPTVYVPAADLVVVPALVDSESAGSEVRVFAVALPVDDRPGAQPAMDRTRSLGWLELAARPAVVLGGPQAAATLLDRCVAALCAEMLGAADAVLEMTTAYAKDRVQFGQPIGSFQAVKHRCADMLVDVEGMRSSSYYAAWAVGAADADASCAASAAKVWCADAASRVMASGLQVHGGIGFTWEHDLHLFIKRSQLDQGTFGDATAHRRRLVELLRPKVEAGEPVL
jgi:alkylation response protein AidB-like acyl-CoA dehydrogenase